MRIDRDRQVTNAARLARMLPPAVDVQREATSIAADITPAISAAITRQIDALRQQLAARDCEERTLLKACRSVGAAVDRLEQARHTPAEMKARQALESTCKALRRQINRKDAHATR